MDISAYFLAKALQFAGFPDSGLGTDCGVSTFTTGSHYKWANLINKYVKEPQHNNQSPSKEVLFLVPG